MSGNHARAVAVLLAAVALAYGPSLCNGFVFDDAMFVRDDPRVRSLGEAPRLFVEPLWGYLDRDGIQREHQYYRPLQTFPLALMRAAFGEQAWPAHLLNLTVHAVNTLLVFSIFNLLLGSSALVLAVSLLWAIHPAYSEAILWVSNLAGLGSALAILGLFRLHLGSAANTTAGRLSMSGLLLVGLLFHEVAIIAPLLLLSAEVTGHRPPRWRRLALELTTCVPAIAFYGWLRVSALGGVVPGLGRAPMTLFELVINGIALLPQFARTFVWPFDLNMYHDFNAAGGVSDPAAIAGMVLIAIAVVCFVLSIRRGPVMALAIAWTAITTLPYLVIRWPQLNAFAERYLYLPSIGVFLLLGALLVAPPLSSENVDSRFVGGLHRSPRWPWGRARPDGAGRPQIISSTLRSATVGGIVLVSIIGILTIWRRARDWRDDVTLYTKTLTQSDRAVLIRNNLAVRLLEQKRHEEGIHVLEAIAETPATTSDTWHNLGLLRAAVGDDRGAAQAFRRASRYGVPRLPTLLNLGYMYDRVGERRNAVETYMRLVDRAPDYVPGWFNLAMVAFDSGQYDNARLAVSRVLEVSPEDREAQALRQRLQQLAANGRGSLPAEHEATTRGCRQAMHQARRGRYREAIILLRTAAWLDERAPVPHQYLANVAALRSDWKTALAESHAALERSPGNPLYRRNIEAIERKLADGERAK